jgi:ABC-type transport system involved in multi-copper enzyme maturation permease subunit
VRGFMRAELLRLRKRRSLQVIVFAVPVLVAVITVLGYNSIYEEPPFDPAAYRQELIDSGYLLGMPPDQAEALLQEAVESYRMNMEQQAEQTRLTRAQFAFPRSLTMALGTGVFILLALVLLTATTIGDEFNWATIRTTLLASANRRRFLLVRFAAIVTMSLLIFGMLLLVGTVVPLALNIPASKLPPTMPAFDTVALLVMLGGEAVAGLAVIAFAALVTLLLRSGALTLVSVLVWVAVEAAILTLLTRFPNFAGTWSNEGVFTPGSESWVLDVFPLRAITTLMQAAATAASGLPAYPGQPITRDLGAVGVPILSFSILAVVFAAMAFRRFQRMDIVE